MIIRGVIQAIRIEGRNQVFVDVLSYADSVNKNVPLFGQFGMVSVPKVGTRCILIALNNDPESLIAIGAQGLTTDAELSEGQTVVGTNDASIKVTREIEMTCEKLKGSVGPLELDVESIAIKKGAVDFLSTIISLAEGISTAPTFEAAKTAASVVLGTLRTFR